MRRPAVRVLRGVLRGVLCAGIVGLAALAAGRGVWKPPVRAAESQRIEITLGADVIDPAVMLLLPGSVRFVVRNTSGVPRALTITGPGIETSTGVLRDGSSGTLDVTFLRPGTYLAGDGRAAAGSIRVRLP